MLMKVYKYKWLVCDYLLSPFSPFLGEVVKDCYEKMRLGLVLQSLEGSRFLRVRRYNMSYDVYGYTELLFSTNGLFPIHDRTEKSWCDGPYVGHFIRQTVFLSWFITFERPRLFKLNSVEQGVSLVMYLPSSKFSES